MLYYLFIYLATINLFDGFVTYIGLETGNIGEANPMMSYLYEMDPLVFLGVKIVLSILLMMFYYLLKTPKSVLIKNLLIFASIIYTLVCFQHYYWIALVISM